MDMKAVKEEIAEEEDDDVPGIDSYDQFIIKENGPAPLGKKKKKNLS